MEEENEENMEIQIEKSKRIIDINKIWNTKWNAAETGHKMPGEKEKVTIESN